MRVHILIACYNRKRLTLSSIMGATQCASAAGMDVSFTVFDDGSTDGTGAAIANLPIEAKIIRGDGDAYWARSMAIAEAAILCDAETKHSDFILWLNDDVVLDASALARLENCIDANPGSVVVGAVRDPGNGEITYSGMRRNGSHPLRFARVNPTERAQAVDTFNGNIVAVPVAVARRLEGIDGDFSHGLADIDYGLRCNWLGIPVLLAPGTFGTCPRNEPPARGSALEDWHRFTGRKGGGNFASLRRIIVKGHPVVWPIFVAGTYGLWWGRRIIGGISRK